MTEQETQQRIVHNWQSVQQQVRETALACGRDPNAIRIIGVTKYVDEQLTRALISAGCRDLGESRPQLMWQKSEAMQDVTPLSWHMIGHLQRNKVRRLLRCEPTIHSIDSERVLSAIAEEATQQGICINVLLEVNISGDEAKTGFVTDAVEPILEAQQQPGIQIRGLMAMAGWGTDPTTARRQFEKTRELRDQLQIATGRPLPELSMGMSGDFQAAIKEGATMVRIGSSLFDGVIERK
ncbi:MAG: YggS family pyridoxal phosphate enzyme [Planctomycetaceae bacterium TMED240]|nr:YggS family pyridoxal phosphate-dependent enzyme [Rhodopirellula sp.]OUX06889.1 MAG: YggS family pyridoxal phosphate enzyme [Planctomycetaceae bacterium TMED240]